MAVLEERRKLLALGLDEVFSIPPRFYMVSWLFSSSGWGKHLP